MDYSGQHLSKLIACKPGCMRVQAATGKLDGTSKLSEEATAVYTISPAQCMIPAKSRCEVEISGLALQPGNIEEHFTCICSGPAGKPNKQTVFDIDLRYARYL